MTIWMTTNLVGIAAICGWIATLAFPPVRAVRLRNALLLLPNGPKDFEWTPAAVPGDFVTERLPPPASFVSVVESLQLPKDAQDLDRALRLGAFLTESAGDLGPVQADLETTMRRIKQGHGYCADFVKVFAGLAHAAGLFSRQWAFSFDGFGGHGHVVAEVFDRSRSKWVLLDVYNNFYTTDASTGEPLSAMEFRESLSGRGQPGRMVPIGPGRPGYIYEDRALDYYRRGLDQWYLVCGNAVFSYDAQPLVRVANRVSGSLGQVVAAMLGLHPRIKVLPTATNRPMVEQLQALGRKLRWALAALCGLCVLLVVQLVSGAPGFEGARP